MFVDNILHYIKDLTQIYNRGRTTISRWIKNYEETGYVARKKSLTAVHRKFDVDQRNWLVDLYKERQTTKTKEPQRRSISIFGTDKS